MVPSWHQCKEDHTLADLAGLAPADLADLAGLAPTELPDLAGLALADLAAPSRP